MWFNRLLATLLTSALMVACSHSNLPQRLDSFVDNAELNSGDYDADDWKRSMARYESLVGEYSSSENDYTEAEKQMAARAMGRYHSLLIKNGIKQSAAYLKEMESILPSYLEGLVDGLGEESEELEQTLEDVFNSEELEKAFEGIGNRLEELFEGLEGD